MLCVCVCVGNGRRDIFRLFPFIASEHVVVVGRCSGNRLES